MSLVDRVINGLRSVALLDQQVADLRSDLDKLSDLHADTRARVLRLEGFVEAAVRFLPPPRRD